MSNSGSSAPVTSRHSWFSNPELGAANISQATAPTKGGVTREAITSVRSVRVSGMSVRAASQPSGAAMTQQITLTETERISVSISGSTKLGSVNSVTKLPSVAWPCLSAKA